MTDKASGDVTSVVVIRAPPDPQATFFKRAVSSLERPALVWVWDAAGLDLK